MLIKICGLSTPETVAAALDSGADMIGLVFFPKSPRHVTLEQAAALADQARGRADIVALVVDPADALLTGIAESVRPNWLQLHGRETPQRVRDIRESVRLPVMKAVGVATESDIQAALAFEGVADRLLLDAKAPVGAALPGGNGVPFDWRLLAGLDQQVRFMLSGGVDPANVAQAVQLVRPWGVDVSSGVENAPGVKDAGRIRAFVAAARSAVK